MTVNEMYEYFRQDLSDIPRVRVQWNHKVIVNDLVHLPGGSDVWDMKVLYFFIFKKVLYFEVL